MPRPRKPVGKPRNWLLASLPDAEYERMAAALHPVDLELKHILFDYDQPIEAVYFPETCVASILSLMADGSAVEAATVGREGMVGLPVFLGTDRMQAQACCQVAGQAFRMDVGAFREAVGSGGELPLLLNRYTQTLFTLVAQSSACNRMHTIRERCARWLLMTHDRIGTDQFSLTQQFLSQMLGVRRAGVTEAAGSLQRAGLIEYSRGQITVKDRRNLEAAACECYFIIQRELERLLANRDVPSPLTGSRFSENGKTTVGDGAPTNAKDGPKDDSEDE